jgi:hypothetical protein
MDQSTLAQKTLMEELGLADLPQEKQEQLAIKMTEVILKRIFMETMERLKEAEQEEFEKMINAKTGPEEVEKFLREKIGDYDQMVEKVTVDFKEEMKKNLIS